MEHIVWFGKHEHTHGLIEPYYSATSGITERGFLGRNDAKKVLRRYNVAGFCLKGCRKRTLTKAQYKKLINDIGEYSPGSGNRDPRELIFNWAG